MNQKVIVPHKVCRDRIKKNKWLKIGKTAYSNKEIQ